MSDQLRAISKINEKKVAYQKDYDRLRTLLEFLTRQEILTKEAGNSILDYLTKLKDNIPNTYDFVQDFLAGFEERDDPYAFYTGEKRKILIKTTPNAEFTIRRFNNEPLIKFVNDN